MSNYNVIPLLAKPGIQRDGTQYNSKAYIDGQWVRFSLEEGTLPAVPNKIGGYKIIDKGDGAIIRTLFDVPGSNSVDKYMGRFNSLKYQHFDFNGLGTGEIDRTPLTGPLALGFHPDPNNLWDFDLFANTDNPQDPIIVAHVAHNANDVGNTIQGPIFYGDTVGLNKNLPLTQIFDTLENPVMVSGGIVYAPPLMVAYGNNGRIIWCEPGQITVWPAGEAGNFQFISNTKILYMANYRGLLAWTTNSLISLAYIPSVEGPNAFATTTIDSTITVMSPRSIVSYKQQFFWIGTDQFYFFNGVVQRLKNTMQTDWFFKNVNFAQRAKVWGMVIPGQREIWWFYPRGDDATECTHVIIYNEELDCWYDSEIGRAAGTSPSGSFPFPTMTDTQKLQIITRIGFTDVYPLWMHEFGYNKTIDEDNISSIDSFIETPIFSLFDSDPKINRLTRVRRIETNFLQNGNMTVTVKNRMFASDTTINGKLITSGPYTFDRDTQKVDDINSQGRLVSVVFRSNELDGAYKMGKTLLCFDIGDVQP